MIDEKVLAFKVPLITCAPALDLGLSGLRLPDCTIEVRPLFRLFRCVGYFATLVADEPVRRGLH
jgi:hypothetical protein